MGEGRRVGVVVVTHRSEAPLEQLMRSLDEHEADLPVVVVDSGSPEGPPDVEGARVIGLEENVGYGAACNAGAEFLLSSGSPPDHLAFLNPDVRLLGPSLTELAAQVDARPRAGIAGPPLIDQEGRRLASAWGPPSALRKFAYGADLDLTRLRDVLGRVGIGSVATSSASRRHLEMRVTGHVLGGAMLVRRTCWEHLDGFDPDFFLYGEDSDLCYRAQQAGWEVWVLPVTPVVHVEGTSSAGVGDEQRRWWHRDGTRIFGGKHLGPIRRKVHLIALRLGDLIRGLRGSRF